MLEKAYKDNEYKIAPTSSGGIKGAWWGIFSPFGGSAPHFAHI